MINLLKNVLCHFDWFDILADQEKNHRRNQQVVSLEKGCKWQISSKNMSKYVKLIIHTLFYLHLRCKSN